MNIDKKIISQIWDGCEKQIVDGYVFIKMDDLIKLEIEEILNQKEKINMDKVATYLNSEGWIFEKNPDTGQVWKRRPGDIHNREKI
tara:strand:+ start:4253 stop:4510 length:258 start_codon:yes stop_codon:yes gene_type:complete